MYLLFQMMTSFYFFIFVSSGKAPCIESAMRPLLSFRCGYTIDGYFLSCVNFRNVHLLKNKRQIKTVDIKLDVGYGVGGDDDVAVHRRLASRHLGLCLCCCLTLLLVLLAVACCGAPGEATKAE
jgi:hypothetical protein